MDIKENYYFIVNNGCSYIQYNNVDLITIKEDYIIVNGYATKSYEYKSKREEKLNHYLN